MENKNSKVYYLISGIISALLAVYAISHVSCLIMLPDEFGYLANAAAMLGWDWSEISSLHSYYSFGYSFLWIPILKYIEDPVWMYRTGILLNYVMVFAHACLLYRLMKSFFPEAGERNVMCVSAAGACYSGFTAYADLGMTEVLLSLVFLCVLSVLWEYLDRTDWKRAVLLSILSAYLFLVHMRTVAVVAAAVLTVLPACRTDRRKRRHAAAALISLGAAFCLAAALRGFLEDSLYHAVSREILGWNSLEGQWKKIGGLFTVSGIRNLCFGMAGKLFYLGNATFYTFYWGMLFLGKKTYRLVREKGGKRRRELIYLFLLLAVLGTFLVTAVYLGGGGRIDGIVYGRYNEFMVPVIICLGLAEMLRNPSLIKGTALLLGFHSLCIWVIDYAVSVQGLTAFQGYMSIGIAFAIDDKKALISGITRGPFLVCGLAAVLLAAGISFIRMKKKSGMYGLLLVPVIFLYAARAGAQTYFYPHSLDNMQDIELAGALLEELSGRASGEVYYVHRGNTEYVDNIQLALRDRSIHVLKDGQEPGPEDFVIVYKEDERNNELSLKYGTMLKNSRFHIYFQEKGATDEADNSNSLLQRGGDPGSGP